MMKRKNILSYVFSLCILAVLIVACSDDDKVENTAGNNGLATVATAVATSYSQYEATLSGSIVADGSSAVTEWGICVGPEPSPTEQIKASGSKESFSVQVGNLEGGKMYYYRAYAINANGISYGEEKIFTTEPILPVVKTASATVEDVSITFVGELIFDGGIALMEEGFCYGTMAAPTLEDGTVVTLSGSKFEALVSNLEPFTDYYVRAYAVNMVGTAYGDPVKVTTGDHPEVAMPFSETFANGGTMFPPKGWTLLDHDGDGNNWEYYKFGNGTTTATSHSYKSGQGGLTPYNFLITPRVAIAGDNPTLKWVVEANSSTYHEEHYKVVVSEVPITNDNCENTSIVNTVFEETLPTEAGADGLNRSVNLAAYVGKSIYIAWVHYNCVDVSRMYIYGIEVIDLPSTDPSLIFPENFDGAVFPPAGWTIIDHDGDGDNWVKSTSSRLTVGAMSDSEGLSPYNLLITPQFEVVGTNPILSWDAGSLASPTGNYYHEHYKIVVSTLGNRFEDFDESKPGVTNVYEKTMTSDYGRAYVYDEVDFTPFIGQTVYVAFIHYNCTDQYGMVVKNINLSEK